MIRSISFNRLRPVLNDPKYVFIISIFEKSNDKHKLENHLWLHVYHFASVISLVIIR